MSEHPGYILADCPTHGRVRHDYALAPDAYVCRLAGRGRCRHFVPMERLVAQAAALHPAPAKAGGEG